MKANGIKCTLVPDYHTASNGAAERAVQVLKRSLKAHVLSHKSKEISIQHKLANFLLMYSCTPHTVTGVSPAELFLKRQSRTCFTLLKPHLEHEIQKKQEISKSYHDGVRVKERQFKIGEQVLVKNCRGGNLKWITGVVMKVCGPRTYVVPD